MNYKNLQTNEGEPEILSGDDAKIRDLLGDLRRVEAPNDFDFRVRARIAQNSPRDIRPRFLPVLRYVLPLAAVLVICAGFLFNSFHYGNLASDSIVAVANTPTPGNQNQSTQTNSVNNNSEVALLPASEKIAAPSAPVIARNNKTASAPNVARQLADKNFAAKSAAQISRENFASGTGGGTRSSALTPPKRVITPPGISLDKTIGDAANFVKTKSLTAREILLQLGIEASYGNEGWKVLSVQENSPAKRSDIKLGDSVEAIDGEKLTDKPLPTRTIEGRKLTVLRGGRSIEISLGTKTN